MKQVTMGSSIVEKTQNQQVLETILLQSASRFLISIPKYFPLDKYLSLFICSQFMDSVNFILFFFLTFWCFGIVYVVVRLKSPFHCWLSFEACLWLLKSLSCPCPSSLYLRTSNMHWTLFTFGISLTYLSATFFMFSPSTSSDLFLWLLKAPEIMFGLPR